MAPPVHRPSRLSSCLAFALLASAPITASQEEPSEPPSPSKEEAEPDKQSIMSWLDERLRWKFVDEELNLTLGGLLQIDGTAVAEDDELEQTFGDIGNSVRARRARLQANGLFYDVLFRAVQRRPPYPSRGQPHARRRTHARQLLQRVRRARRSRSSWSRTPIARLQERLVETRLGPV